MNRDALQSNRDKRRRNADGDTAVVRESRTEREHVDAKKRADEGSASWRRAESSKNDVTLITSVSKFKLNMCTF